MSAADGIEEDGEARDLSESSSVKDRASSDRQTPWDSLMKTDDRDCHEVLDQIPISPGDALLRELRDREIAQIVQNLQGRQYEEARSLLARLFPFVSIEFWKKLWNKLCAWTESSLRRFRTGDRRLTRTRRVSWIRGVLLVGYIAVIVVAWNHESSARDRLRTANEQMSAGSLQKAEDGFKFVIEERPFSLALPTAREGLKTLLLECGDELAASDRPSGPEGSSPVELSPYAVDLFPIIGLPLASLLMLVVFLTRIPRRRVLGLFCLSLSALAGWATCLVWARYGLLRSAWATSVVESRSWFLEEPVLTYSAGAGLLLIACSLTLTTAASRRVR